MLASVEWVDVLITSGFAGTLLTLFLKWRHDKKKAPLDREAVLATASTQNVTDALAISGAYKDQLTLLREQVKLDAQAAEERHKRDVQELRERNERDLTALRERLDGLEEANTRLTRQVAQLQHDDRLKDQELAKQHRRIGKLEKNLGAAHALVVSLMQYIRDHTTDTGSIPVVDYTIFEP